MAKTAEPSPEPRWSVRDAWAVLFVWSLEEEDRSGHLLELEDRRRATRAALEADRKPEKGRWLAPRAHGLLEVFGRRRPWVRKLPGVLEPGRGFTSPAVAGAFVLGLFANSLDVSRLSQDRMLDILAPPLLGLLLWNLGIFVLMLVRALKPAGASGHAGGHAGGIGGDLARRVGSWLERLVRRSADWLLDARRSKKKADGGGAGDGAGDGADDGADDGDGEKALERAVIERYVGAWLPLTAPLTAARVRRLLHLSSLAMVLGVLAGMYARGLVFEYRATWESTFLSPGQVDGLLQIVLAPASAVLGMEIPLAAPLESSAVRTVGGSAAPWIHLWAMTCLLFVGLPRLALATWEGLRLAAASRRLRPDLPETYWRRLKASAATTGHDVQVLPYSHRPTEKASQSLRQLLVDLAGVRSNIRLTESLDYGAEPPEPFPGRLRVTLFNLAQTPELEVHAELVKHCVDDRTDGQALLVLVDESAFRKRSMDDGVGLEERIDSKRRSWRRVLADVGPEPVFVDLAESYGTATAGKQAEQEGELLRRIEASLWPEDLLSGRGR